ncbi:hypothetical protein J7I93_16635 [Bacillus sp. ISL-47]|uniref:hypothetical protein n=1 Tax=Bacillus sp. ISL-47 TaxID=2819130 RepID=UPI001BE93580|nr:hypothetical protein [Bacillus sp. ISL-47]MBT2689815.1 hypothetical protein [Bacillus sp. ISL-47]MBT2709263.1 hypothetical protein [Pseudomonas sp. ISL-84]
MVLKNRTLALNEKFFIHCHKRSEGFLKNDALDPRRKQGGSLHKELKGVFPL